MYNRINFKLNQTNSDMKNAQGNSNHCLGNNKKVEGQSKSSIIAETFKTESVDSQEFSDLECSPFTLHDNKKGEFTKVAAAICTHLITL